ncbi:hypothetical protein FJR38_25695 [Anabaena sp. UHCC 0253]|uniref:hypothetical protein n=1 Tax=Anabaena sp. UHCC 0253 TaxID=2590019 RepID=UPI0014451193|nr:hypothetical protein [Anabaena sp. UHCC 0253]MTJ55814.1 hypothetical protein [Anabaena sp. UHCC 0253]
MANEINFNEHGQHKGDNFVGNKTMNYGPTDSSLDASLNKDEIVKLLEELRTAIRTSNINDSDTKEIAVGEVAKAISETKKANVNNPEEAKKTKDKISECIKATKDIFGDFSNILTIVSSIAKILGLPIP